MPTVKFIVETEATIKRVEIEEHHQFTPVNMVNNVGTRNLAQGFDADAILYLQGTQGQTAKFKIVQVMDGVQVPLAERNFIKISSQNGRSTSSVGFVVQ